MSIQWEEERDFQDDYQYEVLRSQLMPCGQCGQLCVDPSDHCPPPEGVPVDEVAFWQWCVDKEPPVGGWKSYQEARREFDQKQMISSEADIPF